MTTDTTSDTPKLDLELLLTQQKALEEQIKNARKQNKDTALAQVKELVIKNALTVEDLSKLFNFEPPSQPLQKRVKKVYGKAEPKFQYVLNGVVYKYAGRGTEKTAPSTLKDYMKQKGINLAQFKADPKHKIAVK